MVLAVGGGIVLFVGVRSLISPRSIAEPVGIHLSGPSALNEIRGSFGGMHIAVACVMLAGVVSPTIRRWTLVLLMAYMSGLVGGRLVSVFVDGSPETLVWMYLVVEVVLGGLAISALILERDDG